MALCKDCIHEKVCMHRANIQTDTYAYMGVKYDTEKCEHYITADVVPKSEYDAVVSAVDNSTKEFLKLHDDYQNSKAELAELKKDRYQVLPDGRIELLPRTDIDEIKSEVAREIFAEIENIAILNDHRSVKDFYTNHPLIAELKKKYTEEKE